jgi:hypothetical protein
MPVALYPRVLDTFQGPTCPDPARHALGAAKRALSSWAREQAGRIVPAAISEFKRPAVPYAVRRGLLLVGDRPPAIMARLTRKCTSEPAIVRPTGTPPAPDSTARSRSTPRPRAAANSRRSASTGSAAAARVTAGSRATAAPRGGESAARRDNEHGEDRSEPHALEYASFLRAWSASRRTYDQRSAEVPA